MMWLWLMMACSPGRWQAVALGPVGGCATRLNGTVRCWEAESTIASFGTPDGELGEVDVGGEAGIGLDSEGFIQVWSDHTESVADIPSGEYVDVSMDDMGALACAISVVGTIDCWGNLADVSATPPQGSFVELSQGVDLLAAISTMGELQCWNYLDCDEWSDLWFKHVEVNDFAMCALDVEGEIHCGWDKSTSGEHALLKTIPSGSFVDVAVTGDVGCALDSAGKVQCWNEWGEDDLPWTQPPSDTFVDITGGGSSFCGITTENHLSCWGSDWLLTNIDFEM